MSLHALIYIVPYCQQKILHCSIFILQIWFKRLWICCWGEGTGCVSRGGATGWIVWWSKHWGIFTTGCTTKHTAAATRLGIGHRTVFGPEGHSWVLDTNWTSVCNDICQSYSDEDTHCVETLVSFLFLHLIKPLDLSAPALLFFLHFLMLVVFPFPLAKLNIILFIIYSNWHGFKY